MSNNKTNQTGKNAPGKDDGLNAFAKGKLTPHKLSKKAAKVAQDLRDGELAPEDVSRMMREALEKEAMEQLTQAFGKMQGLNKDMYVNRIDSVQVMLGGDLLLSDLSRSACGDNEDLRHRFARSFFANKVWKDSVRQQIVLNDEGVCEKVRDMKLLLQVQKDFDATCKIFQPYIEGHFHKPLKSFCDCYQVDFTTFVGRCVELINKWERFSIENLARDLAYTRSLQTEQQVQAAARGVQAGFDTVRLLCWECGREQAKILKCSVCKAARYCSPACQVSRPIGGGDTTNNCSSRMLLTHLCCYPHSLKVGKAATRQRAPISRPCTSDLPPIAIVSTWRLNNAQSARIARFLQPGPAILHCFP